MERIELRYGMNPHQRRASAYAGGRLPVRVLNGEASYINLLDAFNAFQLVRELKRSTGLPAAASFKHVSPAGAAVHTPLGESLARSYFADGMELSPLAVAYARARGADRMSSFGDCAAFSCRVDASSARLLQKEVSDLIVAPGYDRDALELLKRKKNGAYLILEIDPDFVPAPVETRTVFGMTLEQERNDAELTEDVLANVVTKRRLIPPEAKRDLLVALIALKYTQSNSVCLACGGQTIGIGAGQQSRIHCTRLAAEKADHWMLRQHPAALRLPFRSGLSRADMNNALDGWLNEDAAPAEEKRWRLYFDEVPERLTKEEKAQWLTGLTDVAYASDAFLPFRDNLDRAARSGVRYVVQTGSSARDDEVAEAADEYGMVMACSGIRLFHH
ncbi:phosphoribosylaminoimidazolecarboxamide formyltransferase [Paenibacillus humicola]|uniref:phosphoribosylaminoimidazolecarboxamide formyltransferase n=1 Tax=Paenibacillus humicola TaxID=3110540 RepID=UPI00237B5B14|nr:phosphoribosylaminoimidazolecarboxamide formyltransferase [Paenibacillus humicola]